MSLDDKQYIMLGKLNAHHGIKGWLKVFSYTDPKQNILSYKEVFLFRENQLVKEGSSQKDGSEPTFWKQVKIINGRLQGKGVVVHFEGYDNREVATELIGSTIGVNRDALAKLDENDFYWVDLIGLQVVNQENIILGKIKSLLPTVANDVMVVKPSVENEALQKEYLIPYIMGKYVLDVDLSAGIMQVDWDVAF